MEKLEDIRRRESFIVGVITGGEKAPEPMSSNVEKSSPPLRRVKNSSRAALVRIFSPRYRRAFPCPLIISMMAEVIFFPAKRAGQSSFSTNFARG